MKRSQTFDKQLLRACAVLILALLLPAAGEAKEFEFKYPVGLKYKILSEVDERVYANGFFSHQADILNRISVEITDFEEGKGTLEGRFITTERLKGSVSAYQIDQSYDTVYRRGTKGDYDIDAEYYMPVVRNVPIFPDGDVQIGDTWRRKGEEVHDFRRGYGISEPFRIPFVANYRYQGRETIEGKAVDVITVQYHVRHRTGPYFERYPLYPVRISGFSDQVIYWDEEAGHPYAYNEQFSMLFVLSNGDYYEFAGTAWARVTESIPMDKVKVAEEINRRIREDKVEDVEARVDETGVTLNLPDLKFTPDSAELLDSEKEKLDRIIEYLSRWPEKDLEITGHTALAGTAAGRQRLSELRAQRVAEYLLEKGAREATEIIIEGKGAREPVADNSTPEGMRQNRRVEITILEN
jgi:outer membrane protein OmpA-like peptidoglycan-associated protein